MVAMATETLLTTAPAGCTILHPPKWSPASRIPSSRLKIWTSRPLRVSCCASAIPVVGRIEEPSGGDAIGGGDDGGGGGDDDGDSSSSGRSFGEVYVASVALRAPKGAALVFDVMKDLESCANFQHYMTIIKPNEEGAPCTVLDFQPEKPEDLMTAVAVLMGNSIPGVLLERTLSRLPKQRCWKVGPMKPGLSLEDAVAFSRGFNSKLDLGINDCRHHTLDLAEYLTGKSMSFIEEVRLLVPKSTDENEWGIYSEEPVGLRNEVENKGDSILEESPDVDSVETSEEDLSSIKERVFYALDFDKTDHVSTFKFHDKVIVDHATEKYLPHERNSSHLVCKVEHNLTK